MPEEVFSGPGEVLELENPGIIPWEVLFGVPWRSPEALQPPVLLEPREGITGKTNYFTSPGVWPAPFCGPHGLTPSERTKAAKQTEALRRYLSAERGRNSSVASKALPSSSLLLGKIPAFLAQAHPLPPNCCIPWKPQSLRVSLQKSPSARFRHHG